jgi:hypothetical protein
VSHPSDSSIDESSHEEIIWTELMIVKLEVHSVLNHCTGIWDTFQLSVY